MSSPNWQCAVLVLALGGLARCTSSSGLSLAACSGAVTVTPTSDLAPTLAWAPNCLVDQVTVEEEAVHFLGGLGALVYSAVLEPPANARYRMPVTTIAYDAEAAQTQAIQVTNSGAKASLLRLPVVATPSIAT